MEYTLAFIKSSDDCIRVERMERVEEGSVQLDELNSLRNSIDKISMSIWKRIRWFINHHDFIVKDPIINRAFFKYWEIIQKYKLLENANSILHLAEAPGGFIQGSNIFFKRRKRVKKFIDSDGFECVYKTQSTFPSIFTMSLDKENPKYIKYNLPSYNTDVLKSNVYICYGKDNTGDICQIENYRFLIEYMSKILDKDDPKIDFITADGGFDEGDDFNNKEELHYKLIMYEIFYGIHLQSLGGSFLIKMFDTFTSLSRQFLYLLRIYYEQVYVYKPYTSRPTNSEKYIVCKGFKGMKRERQLDFLEILQEMNTIDFTKSTLNICRDVPEEFIRDIKQCNHKFVESQCMFLRDALDINEETYYKKLSEIRVLKKSKYEEWKKNFDFLN